MLQKRRDLGSIPDGLGVTASEMKKGIAVVRKFNEGVYTYEKPSTKDDEIYGFVTLRIDEDEHKDSYYDVIPKGKKAVVYTLAKNNEWATTEFVGTLSVGDKCGVGFTGENAGKITKYDESNTTAAIFEVIGVSAAMAGYEEAMVTVKVLN